MAIFKGAASALITPFTEDYKVDFNKLEELVDIQIENGVDAIVVCGTTGEACLRTKRKFIGIEKNKDYFEMACKRLEKILILNS